MRLRINEDWTPLNTLTSKLRRPVNQVRLCACNSVHAWQQMKVLCVCVMALLECNSLFLCCCSFAAVHIMSSHLLLAHSLSLFFPPLISLPVFCVLPIAQTKLRGRSHESVTGAQPPPLSVEKSSLEIQSNYTITAAKRIHKKLLPSSIRTA